MPIESSSIPGRDRRAALPQVARCRRCGSAGYPVDRYCACCGGEMPRRCRMCGAEMLHKIANYCTQCGAPFGGEQGRETDPR